MRRSIWRRIGRTRSAETAASSCGPQGPWRPSAPFPRTLFTYYARGWFDQNWLDCRARQCCNFCHDRNRRKTRETTARGRPSLCRALGQHRRLLGRQSIGKPGSRSPIRLRKAALAGDCVDENGRRHRTAFGSRGRRCKTPRCRLAGEPHACGTQFRHAEAG
jgi:hypothetical protein